MIGLDALTTFSGLLAALATYLTIMGKRLAGAVIYVIVGAGGLAILWERWSERTGEPAHFSAFLSSPATATTPPSTASGAPAPSPPPAPNPTERPLVAR